MDNSQHQVIVVFPSSPLLHGSGDTGELGKNCTLVFSQWLSSSCKKWTPKKYHEGNLVWAFLRTEENHDWLGGFFVIFFSFLWRRREIKKFRCVALDHWFIKSSIKAQKSPNGSLLSFQLQAERINQQPGLFLTKQPWEILTGSDPKEFILPQMQENRLGVAGIPVRAHESMEKWPGVCFVPLGNTTPRWNIWTCTSPETEILK